MVRETRTMALKVKGPDNYRALLLFTPLLVFPVQLRIPSALKEAREHQQPQSKTGVYL
jgi:hypothetical protein